MTSRLLALLILVAAAISGAAAAPRGAVAEKDVADILRSLDRELGKRDVYESRRQKSLDSIAEPLRKGRMSFDIFRRVGTTATGYDNDIAMRTFIKGMSYADSIGDHRRAMEFSLLASPLMTLAGFNADATRMYEAIDTAGFDLTMKRLYHDSGRRIYNYVAIKYASYPLVTRYNDSISLANMQELARLNHVGPMAREPLRLLIDGELLFRRGAHREARDTLLLALEAATPADGNIAAIASYFIAAIAADLGNSNERIYYLAQSAIADIRSATRETTALQELAEAMLERDDIDRAHTYMSVAMQNSARADAPTRIIQTARTLPLIIEIHARELEESRSRIRLLFLAMALLIILLGCALALAHRRSRMHRRLQARLEASNLTKEAYITRFLDLCAIYMEKLDQLCRVASNKISTGQVDELYRLTNSGKFVENNSSEFYAIFDDAFLHIYPEFVEKVNGLLRPEARITLREGEKLNTDLRILAFMRLGVDDTARVGRILNYSVNTIYAYRNRLRNRAINRETFEADVASL